MGTCLHFRIDRQSGVCQTCGQPVVAVAPSFNDVAQALFPGAAPGIHDSVIAEIPAEENVHEFLAGLKAAAVKEQEPEPAALPLGPDPLVGMAAAGIGITPVLEHVAPTMRSEYLAQSREGMGADEDEDSDDYDRSAGPPNEPLYHFIGGTAGTGKTYQARQRAEQYSDAMLCATTGIAAVNIGGVTINSLLGYADTDDMRVSYEVGKLGAFLRRLKGSGYHRLILDEVSMMDGHQLDILTAAIEDINQWCRENNKRELGLTLVGDFAQLPPVNAPYVFQRPSWSLFEPHQTILTEPRRQADANFVRALQAVRRGDRRMAMDYFGSRIVTGEEREYNGSTILAKNDEVDRYNNLRLMQLAGPEDRYVTTRFVKDGGKEPAEWRKNIPDVVRLKRGALVMILANRRMPGDPTDNPEMIYANGDLGIYKEPVHEWIDHGGSIGDTAIAAVQHRDIEKYKGSYTWAKVTLHRTGQDVLVPMQLRQKGKPTGRAGKKLARTEVEAEIEYMPLRVAYATTCHKSQGLSLDNVQIMFHSKFWAHPGMLYVALSRARTPQGLRLVGTPGQFEARINTDPNIRRWL